MISFICKDTVLLTVDKTQESTAGDLNNDETPCISNKSTSPIASSLATLTQTNKEEAERISEADSTKTTMASTELSQPKKKEKKRRKSAKLPSESCMNKHKDLSIAHTSGGESNLNCLHCNVKFYNKNDFQTHCRTEKHQHTVMSDEGKK